MSQNFGMQAPGAHHGAPRRAVTRYLVLIDAAGTTLARLFLHDRTQVAEFDAGTEEVALMTQGLAPLRGADGPEWDRALEGHSAEERRGAEVYTLDV
jgi:hypothetical protein